MKQDKGCLFWTVPEVVRMLGIHRLLAYKLIRKGEIPSIRVGKHIRVPKDKFATYIGRKTIHKVEVK